MSEPEISQETISSGGTTSQSPTMTLQKAVNLGEYDPDYLATFSEWHTLSKSLKWQMIKTAIENRERQLVQQWAEINNVIDFSKKPHLREALRNIEDQRHRVLEDKEKYMLEYSKI